MYGYVMRFVFREEKRAQNGAEIGGSGESQCYTRERQERVEGPEREYVTLSEFVLWLQF